MNEAAYRAWQVLHDRWAKGETLTPEEQAVYEAGCAELDAEEILPGSLSNLQAIHAKAMELDEQIARAQSEFAALRAQIAETEARLSEPTRRRLGISTN
jgi:peptidoglycan hydrolase CwlO-like protein